MAYQKTKLTAVINIREIVSIHYFEFAKDYIFEGETHNFWELVYVDKGKVEVMADDRGLELKQGEVIFHKPNEFHNLWADGQAAPDLIVLSFYSDPPAMPFFENKIFQVSDYEKQLLAQIILEAKNAFSSPLNISSLQKLQAREDSLFGSEQLIRLYLEEFLISLRRRDTPIRQGARLSSVIKNRSDHKIAERAADFLKNNIYHPITFGDVCGYIHMGRTSLKSVFKSVTNQSVMEYYRNLKIEEAKRLIREEAMNFTQIADRLGYSSIHYFSKQFKDVTGMTLSEYSYSTKVYI